MHAPTSVYVTYIRATPHAVWRALTDGAMTEQYYFGLRIEGDWREGGAWTLRDKSGEAVSEGVVRVCDPPRTLELTWRVLAYDPPPAPALICYNIEALGDVVRLTMTQTDPPDAPSDWAESARWGTQITLSAMKTLLETGTTFHTPPPGA